MSPLTHDVTPSPAGGLSLTEGAVLALVAEQPVHGFAVARQLEPETDLGRILTVHRPLVYRAIDQLVGAGLAKRSAPVEGERGPKRQIVAPTQTGAAELEKWLATPVAHVRDVRIELLLKLRLLERRGDDPSSLLAKQRKSLDEPLRSLTSSQPSGDVVDRWRQMTAEATLRFLEPTGLS
jgi:DNA-binding PadR family transcriptional regulator